MSSRLSKEMQHKTKQAEKLLQILKEKREKKKMVESIPPNIHPQQYQGLHNEIGLQDKKSSNASINDSFRTCTNADGCLAELYFKIFSQHMADPTQAAQDLDNCLQNMRKQVIKLTDQSTSSKQMLKNATEKVDRMDKQSKAIIQKLNLEISDLKNSLKDERNKNRQLQEKKNEALNTSGALNSSIIYEGYEEKLKELTAKLEIKEQQVRNVWEKNRDCQTQIFFLQKKEKNWQRQKEQCEKQKQILLEMVQKLSSEVKSKETQKIGVSPEVLTLKQKEFIQLKSQFENQIESLKKKLSEEQKKHEMLKNQSKQAEKEFKQRQLKLNQELKTVKEQLYRLTLANQQKNKQFELLLESLKAAQTKFSQISDQLAYSKQENGKIQAQLRNKMAQFSSANDSHNDRVAVLMAQKHQIEQILKETRAQHEDITRGHKLKVQEMQANRVKQVEKCQKEALRYQTQISGLRQKNDEMASQMQSKQTQINELISITEQLTEELANAKQELDEYENRIMVMKEENAQLIQNREHHRNKLEEFQIKIKNVEHLSEAKQNQQQSQISYLKSQTAKQAHLISQLTNENQSIKQNISQIEEELTTLRMKNDRNQVQHQQQLSKLNQDYQRSQEVCKTATAKCQQLQDELKQLEIQNLQLLAKASSGNTNQFMDQLIAGLKDQVNQKKKQIQSLTAQASASKKELAHLSGANQLIKQEAQTFEAKVKSIQEERNKDSKKYIKTIEELTQELNEAYRKVNEHTRISLQNQGKDSSREKNNRPKSVNKLKSYFGFGNKNQSSFLFY